MAKQWQCSNCNALLGINEAGGLSVRYKEAQYIINGEELIITTFCRRCFELNQLIIPKNKAKQIT